MCQWISLTARSALPACLLQGEDLAKLKEKVQALSQASMKIGETLSQQSGGGGGSSSSSGAGGGDGSSGSKDGETK